MMTWEGSTDCGMKLIRTEDAVGNVICHDMTQIIKGKVKDAVYVWEESDSMMHENEAAEVLREICCGEHIGYTPVKEGKIEFISDYDGLLKIKSEKLIAVNSYGQMMVAVRHGDSPVRKGDRIGGTRVIPLVIERKKMEGVRTLVGHEPLLSVHPYRSRPVGIVTTGNELYYGRIEDSFSSVLVEKMRDFGCPVVSQIVTDDQSGNIERAIKETLAAGAGMVLCTGGMSVDPDDNTPLAIKNVCKDIVVYGVPVLPGAMFMLAYYGEDHIPVLGLPGCVMYSERTVLDLVLPRIMADEMLTEEDFYILGEGGFCLNCEVCTFPNCGFGKK